MASNGRLTAFLVLNCLMSITSTFATTVDLTSFKWGGVRAYIAVNRQTVQDRLDDYHHTLNPTGPKAPQLYVPRDRVFTDLLTNDQHVIYIDFGFMSSPDFTDKSSISSFDGEMSVVIPFLSTTEVGVPNYALALATMYDMKKGDIFNPQPIFKYVPVDGVTIDDDGASLTSLSETMIRVTFNQTHPCRRASANLMNEFNDFLLNNNIFSATPDPDLTFCDRHTEIAKSEYCLKFNDIKTNIQDALPNVCARYTQQLPGDTPCEVSMEIVSVDDRFRGFLLLGDTGRIKVVAAEKYAGTFTSGLKYPCV